MTTVNGKLIGFASPQRVEMKATLVDVTGKDAVGYVSSVPGELVRPVSITPDSDGDWTIQLTANSLITSQAGDTLWAIQEGRKKDGTPIVSYIAVPDSSTTWWVGDILADLSSTQTGNSTVVYLASAPGADGASAYQVAVANGFVGSEAEWLATLVGPKGDPGTGGGAVDSVNNLTGVVVLDAAAVGADPAGAATSAGSAAVSAAATDATAKVTTHATASDPHGDRTYADGKLAKSANLSDLTDPAAGRTSLGLGTSATRNVGTTAGTVTAGDDARLTNARTPTAHATSHQAGGSDELALTQAQITGLAAALAALFPKTGGTLAGDLTIDGHNLTVQRADGQGAYRLRVTGGGLDLEVGGMDVIVSTWSGPDFTGTQADVLRLEPAGPHLIGRTQFGTNGYDDVHDIDPATGVAALGGKNGSLNLRFCGRRTTTGSPTTGAWIAGDAVQDAAGAWWLCTADGSPGTWVTPPATPTAHAATHATGGSDPIAPGSIGAETAGTATAAVTTHTGATDPHGDRAYTDTQTATRVPTTRQITAGTGLTGGGTLAADRTLAVAYGITTATAAEGNDSRLSDARTPTAHASSHASGGSDPVTPSAIGALPAAGGTISGNLAVTGNALGLDTPATHGAAAWCYDPALAVNSTQLTAGTLYLVRVDIASAVNATKLHWWVANTGSSAVAGQNWVGLYRSDGTLLASTGVDASFSTATLKTTTISSQALSAGSFYWVALLFNASVTPTLTRASGWTGVDTAANLGLSAAAYRFAKNGTGRATLPSTITPASNVGTDFAGPWAAVGA